jgi:hypothetical protein
MNAPAYVTMTRNESAEAIVSSNQLWISAPHYAGLKEWVHSRASLIYMVKYVCAHSQASFAVRNITSIHSNSQSELFQNGIYILLIFMERPARR